MVVAQTQFKFQEYRNKASALRSAAQDVLESLQPLPDFKAVNKYLLKRASLSSSMTDMLVRGKSRVENQLRKLISELDAELKELEDLLTRLTLPGSEAFHQFQRSAVAHQHTQHAILTDLLSLGVNFFNAIDGQIHARTQTVERAHNQFREKVEEFLHMLTSGVADKGAIANTWSDCLEFLTLYVRDEDELGLSRHTYVQLVEAERYGYAKHILAQYFNFGLGQNTVDKLRKQGLVRNVKDKNSNKKNYEDLDDKKKKEVDGIIKDSLMKLLKDIIFDNPHNGKRYVWSEDDGGDDSIEKLIGGIYKDKKDDKITDKYKKGVEEVYNKLLDAINKAGFSFKTLANNGSESGPNSLIVGNSLGHPISLKTWLSDDKDDGLLTEKKFDEHNAIRLSLLRMLEGKKPHKDNAAFKQFLKKNEGLFNENVDDPTNPNTSTQTDDELKDRMNVLNSAMDSLCTIVRAQDFADLGIHAFASNSPDVTRLISPFKVVFQQLLGDDESEISISGTDYDLTYFNEFVDKWGLGVSNKRNEINTFMEFCKNNFNDLKNGNNLPGPNGLMIQFFNKLFDVIESSRIMQV